MSQEQEQPKFFMLDDGTEDFYKFPDDWDEDEEEAEAEEIEIDVDLRKIVLVDSSAFHRNILKSQLESAGFKVAGIAGSASEAQPLLADQKIRFVAVDIDQTDGGGARAVQIIAAFSPKTVFILTSSRLTAEQAAQSGMGNCYFLSKPFKKETVQEVMKKAYDAELTKKKVVKKDASPSTGLGAGPSTELGAYRKN